MNKDDKFYLGSSVHEFENDKDRLQQRIKNLLMLNNVNFLFGNGASLALGAPLISNVKSIISIIDKNTTEESTSSKTKRKKYFEKIKKIENFEEGITTLKSITDDENFYLDIETFLNALIQSHNIASLESFESDEISIGGE